MSEKHAVSAELLFNKIHGAITQGNDRAAALKAISNALLTVEIEALTPEMPQIYGDVDTQIYGFQLRQVGGGAARGDGSLLGAPAKYEYDIVHVDGRRQTGAQRITQQLRDGQNWCEYFRFNGGIYLSLLSCLRAYEVSVGVDLKKEEPAPPIKFWYRNHSDQVSMRTAVPLAIEWGRTPYHPEDQYFLLAFDVEKEATREFALRDVLDLTGGGQ